VSPPPLAASSAAAPLEPSAAEPGDWQRLLAGETPEAFAQGWLAVQAAWIGEVRRGVLHWRSSRTAAVSLAGELHAGDAVALQELAERTWATGRGQADTALATQGRYGISCVVEILGSPRAVAAFEVEREDPEALAVVHRQLQWGVAWIERRLAEPSPPGDGARLLDLVAAALDAADAGEAAQAVVTGLATSLGCDRVSLGLLARGDIEVVALSHSADFGRQMDLARSLAAAMNEAHDQGVTLQDPPATQGAPRVTAEHEALLRAHGAASVLTVLLPAGPAGEGGALTLEHGAADGFPPEAVRLCEAVAATLAPILFLRRREERSLPAKILESGERQLARWLGPGYPGRKLAAVAIAAVALFFSFATGEYRIAADGHLEGERRRSVVAPFDGYVAASEVRAGDRVRAGDLLASLDARDLELERLKWSSRLAQLGRQSDEARAAGERAQASILSAQIDEARAELDRIEERLARTRIVAPFDGLLVSGDLTQSLGGAVARGDLLFEIAPVTGYRAILQVDEQQIADVDLGQRGRMILAAFPREPLGLEVTKVTPVATAEEGRNFFRVEATLERASERLRPGMEGVGKIEAGERRLLWIWTRSLRTWLRLQLWSWWP